MPSYGHSTSFFFFFVFLALPFAKTKVIDDCHIDSIYIFGDSLSDTGNLPRYNPSVGLLFVMFPYGETIGKGTGRPSDGLLMIDYFAKHVGVPLLPPYLDKNASFEYGANFAVSGATVLDLTFLQSINISNPFTNSSLSLQYNWFNSFKSSLCHSHKGCKKKFERSLFFVGEIGQNDFNFASLAAKPIEEWKSTLVPLVVKRIVSTIKKLIKDGAAHLIIPGDVPVGCAPFLLSGISTNDSTLYDEFKCYKPLNQFAQYYNQRLKNALTKLRRQHPSIDILYADYYNAFISLLKNSDNYGFDESTLIRSCCGIGGQYNFDLKRLCGTPEATVCQDPSKYIFWDGIHYTQEANRLMTIEMLSNGLIEPDNKLRRRCLST